MRKFLILILYLFLASTLVVSLSCKKEEEVKPAPTDILAFFDESVEEGTLEGHGLDALRKMIKTATDQIESGRIRAACWLLMGAQKATDGEPQPPDSIEGEAAPELARRIEDMRRSLGCIEPRARR